MQQYEDAAADDAEDDPVDGANGGAEDGDHPPPAENSSAPAAANDGQQQTKHQQVQQQETDDEDFEDPRQPPRTNGGGYWRQGVASRPQSPTMADNVSDASSMAPPARPKSRVDLATSRYGRCCKDRLGMGMGDFNERTIQCYFKNKVFICLWQTDRCILKYMLPAS